MSTHHLKRGDVVDLDCGYNGMCDMQLCKLLEDPHLSKALFPGTEPSWYARVEILITGETFNAHMPAPVISQEEQES